MKTFAERLKKLREEHRLSQRELSRLIGAGHSSVLFLKTGKRIPGIDKLVKLCEILDVSADYLVGLKNVE